MPLGKDVGKNITKLTEEGYSGKQRTAIALEAARKAGAPIPEKKKAEKKKD